MVDQRKSRRPEDADAGDGDRYDRNGLAMKRLIPVERRSPRFNCPWKEKHWHYSMSDNR